MIYLDHNATTPVDEGVLRAMTPFFAEQYANAESFHHFAETARDAIAQSRVAVGRLIGCRGDDLIFTSGATEACNHAILGAAWARPERRHIVTTSVEHRCVLEPIARLERQGYDVTRVGVDEHGGIDLSEVEAALRDDTLLVACMLANNETGVLMPAAEVAGLARARGALSLCDATQAVGKVPVSVRELGVDLLALSAHKMHGPKGVGALYVRRGVSIESLMLGGAHQGGRRAGTENVAGVVGLGMAAFIARQLLADGVYDRVAALRDRLEQGVLDTIDEVRVQGAGRPRLPNTTNLGFARAAGEAILQHLDEIDVQASTSSACHSNTTEPSHVLTAMGVPTAYLHGTVRLSLGRGTTEADVDEVLARMPRIVERARAAATAETEQTARYDAFVALTSA